MEVTPTRTTTTKPTLEATPTAVTTRAAAIPGKIKRSASGT
jgi:hypothetical protein